MIETVKKPPVSQISTGFHGAAGRARSKTLPPFSLRLSAEERATLKEQAGTRPLGAYIRSKILGDKAEQRRKSKRPRVDQGKLGLALSELGRSNLASNMNQLARAANMGALEVSEEVVADLSQACRDISLMREALIEALGILPEDGS